MSKRVMVASRAIRRGRRLRARSTMPPPPQAGEAIADEASQQTAIEPPPAPESGEGLLGERRPSDAPADDGEPALGEEAEVVEEQVQEQDDEEDGPLDRTSGYSRPPAPAFDFGGSGDDEDEETAGRTDVAMAFDEDDEEPPVLTPITRKVIPEEGEDPNATTLISVPSPRPASTPPPPSQITIEEAAPSSERLGTSAQVETDEAGFVPEGEEPPISEPSRDVDALTEQASPSSPLADVRVGYRDEDASLAPVVDDLALEDEAELALFEAAADKRRHSLRRVVGAVLAAVVVGTVALIVASALRGGEEPSAQAAPPAAIPPAPVAEQAPSDGESAVPASAEEAPVEAAADAAPAVEGDYDTLSTQTLELLNDREFDRARELAERLVALEPDNAFGYRCLGSALQDMGKIREAREVYSQCVSKATKGEVSECRALGGAKR